MGTRADIENQDVTVAPADRVAVDHQTMAALMSCDEKTLRKWRDAGHIPYVDIGGTIRYPVRACADALAAKAMKSVKG